MHLKLAFQKSISILFKELAKEAGWSTKLVIRNVLNLYIIDLLSYKKKSIKNIASKFEYFPYIFIKSYSKGDQDGPKMTTIFQLLNAHYNLRNELGGGGDHLVFTGVLHPIKMYKSINQNNL